MAVWSQEHNFEYNLSEGKFKGDEKASWSRWEETERKEIKTEKAVGL